MAVPRTAPRPAVVQRFSDGTIDEAVRQHVKDNTTTYGARDQAGNCVRSAQEVGQALATLTTYPGTVGYAAVVYWDGGARNHITATFTVSGEHNVVDHAWKQFPFLAKQPTGGPSPFIGTIDDWERMMRGYVGKVKGWQLARFDDATEAREWMNRERQSLLLDTDDDTTHAPGQKKKKSCTIL